MGFSFLVARMERSVIRGRVIPDYAEFIIGSARGRTRWLHPGYELRPLVRSQNLLVGLRLRRASRSLHQCADDAAARQFDFEGIVRITPGVAPHQGRRPHESGLFGGLPAQ